MVTKVDNSYEEITFINSNLENMILLVFILELNNIFMYNIPNSNILVNYLQSRF